jgi:hypothetical protein
MDITGDSSQTISRNTFFSHVFSSSEEGKAEILNVVQYSLLGVVPVLCLNKLIQRFIPDADSEKSSVELLAEILIQLILMFVGIIIIHRIITYIPTYSEFKYESLTLTNVILAFLILVLSIQTKLGIKVNILVDRVMELWNGPTYDNSNKNSNNNKKNVRVRQQSDSRHSPSQGDYLDTIQTTVFPPAPMASSSPPVSEGYDYMMRSGASTNAPSDYGMMGGPMAANSVLGGAFGSSF